VYVYFFGVVKVYVTVDPEIDVVPYKAEFTVYVRGSLKKLNIKKLKNKKIKLIRI